MSKCANCGAELEPGTKFCSECGTAVPQIKVCPECGSEQKPEAKFCSNCGHRFGASAADGGGADMGLKIGHSTVMGDISNAVNYVTNVTNADETKHVVKCHVCGKVLSVVGTHECPKCHGNVCDEHFDLVRKMCTACVEQVQKEGEAAFRQAIREELAAGDGRITQEAFGRLRQKRMALGLDEARGRELIAAERRAEAPADGTVLTDVQRRFLERAKHLIFNDGKCAEGVAEIDRLLGSGVALGDEILAVLMPALLVCDEKRGNQIAERTLVDSLPVALYRVDLALLHGDLISAEKSLIGAEGIWSDEILVKCRRVVFTCALYDESGDESYSDKAAELFDALPQEDADETEKDPLTASWRRYASNRVDLILGNGDEIEPLDEDDGRYAALVYGRLTEPCGGPMRKRRGEMRYDEGVNFRDDEDDDQSAVRCFHEAAEDGFVKAMEELAECYYNGKGVDQNREVSYKWYLKSAQDAGCSAYTFYSIGFMVEHGQGVEESDEEAAKWYLKAAERGSSLAQCCLAKMYESGRGVAKSDAEAAKWYRESAEQGDAEAQCCFGVMCESGSGVEQSDAEAVKWFQKSADHENARAQFNLGWMYEKGRGVEQSDVEAVEWYLKAANQGHVRAQLNLGAMCDQGRGVAQSYVEAVKWYRKAAEQGHATALGCLGTLYETGKGVAQSDEEALKLYQKAAEKGWKYAAANISRVQEKIREKQKPTPEKLYARGVALMKGDGCAKSETEAFQCFEKAAASGHVKAMEHLAECYYYGRGAGKDLECAFQWYTKASKKSECSPYTFYCVGFMLEHGQGVGKSVVKAEVWYREAVKRGNSNAKEPLEKLQALKCKPENVKASRAKSAHSITVTWSDCPGAVSYRIYRRAVQTCSIADPDTDGELAFDYVGAKPVLTGTAVACRYEDSEVVQGHAYVYWVRAVLKGNQVGPASPGSMGWTVIPLSNLHAYVKGRIFMLMWDSPNKKIYQTACVFRSRTPSLSEATLVQRAGPGTFYSEEDRNPNDRFYYWASAVVGSDSSSDAWLKRQNYGLDSCIGPVYM